MTKGTAVTAGTPVELERATLAKVARRLIPFMFLLYVVNILDRVNVGIAVLTMKKDLGFSDEVYGLGAGIFFVGYFFFEVPSNLLLQKIGAKKTIMRITIGWGLTSIAMMFVKTPEMFYFLRFLLVNSGRVLSRSQILDHVWEYDFGGNTSVVDTYISYLRKKVDRFDPSLIQTVRGVGYSLRTA